MVWGHLSATIPDLLFYRVCHWNPYIALTLTMMIERCAIITVRVMGIIFALAAALSIPPTRDMLKSDIEMDDDMVVYVPIEICIPSEITFDDQSITVPTTDIGTCHTLSFFINACVMSLVLSIVATGMYLSFDMARRVKFGNMSASAVRSMSVFLVFIILQTSVCCWAIAKELSFWNDYFDKVHEELDHPFISDIQTRGYRIRLIFTGILGIVFYHIGVGGSPVRLLLEGWEREIISFFQGFVGFCQQEQYRFLSQICVYHGSVINFSRFNRG